LEKDYGSSSLSNDALKRILEDHELEANIRNLLGFLEHVAVGLHPGIYDQDILCRMAATFIIQTHQRFQPYMAQKRHDKLTMYIQFQELAL
jgi:uncharacterized protein DUF4760